MGGMFQKITTLINLILKHMMVNHEVWVYSGAPYQETTHCGTTYHNIRSKAPWIPWALGTSTATAEMHDVASFGHSPRAPG
jgi:hypothetical protein